MEYEPTPTVDAETKRTLLISRSLGVVIVFAFTMIESVDSSPKVKVSADTAKSVTLADNVPDTTRLPVILASPDTSSAC